MTGKDSNRVRPPLYDVVGVGECLVDLISTETVPSLASASQFQRVAGGQPANVANNVARMGGRAAFIGKVGNDPFAEFLCDRLTDAGVETSGIVNSELHPTTLVPVTKSAATPDFLVYRGADRWLTPEEVDHGLVTTARWLHTSLFALSKDPQRSAVLAAIRAAAEAGVNISLDPNYHPGVWGGESPVPVLGTVLPFVDVVKPSLDDCRRLLGHSDPEDCARYLLDAGAGAVVLTAGSAAVLLATRDKFSWFEVPPTNVVDVTGAGDAFWAGLILATGDGCSLEDSVHFAIHVARIKVQRTGHVPGELDRSEIYARIRAGA